MADSELALMALDVIENKKYLYDAIKYGKKVLEISSKEYQRHSAVQILCFSYSDIGQLDEAVKMAESMPFMSISKEMLLSSVYTGNKLYTAKQNKFDNLLQFLSNSLFFMQTKLDSGEMAYTPKEQAILRDKRIELLHLFFENGDFGFYHTHLCDTHCEQAFYYAEINDFEKALEYNKRARKQSVCYNVKLYSAMGDVLEATKNLNDCEFEFLDKRNLSTLYRTRAFYYLKQKKYDLALNYLNKSIINPPENYDKYKGNNETYLLLAEVYKAMKQPDKARHYYELVLKTSPYNYKAQKGIGLISK